MSEENNIEQSSVEQSNVEQSSIPQFGQVNQEQIKAIQVFIQAVNVAQKRGAYNLDEAEIINQAVKQFVVKENKEQTQQNESSVNNNDTQPKVI